MIGGTQFQEALDLCRGILRVEQAAARLLDWDIQIKIGSTVPDNGSTIAQITWDATSHAATITIPTEHDERFAAANLVLEGDTPLSCLRRSIRHELLHLYVTSARARLEAALKDEESAREAFHAYEELWIERTVRTLDAHVPLVQVERDLLAVGQGDPVGVEQHGRDLVQRLDDRAPLGLQGAELGQGVGGNGDIGHETTPKETSPGSTGSAGASATGSLPTGSATAASTGPTSASRTSGSRFSSSTSRAPAYSGRSLSRS